MHVMASDSNIGWCTGYSGLMLLCHFEVFPENAKTAQ
jgi:hypothetical protein